jgi:hypothetical protein
MFCDFLSKLDKAPTAAITSFIEHAAHFAKDTPWLQHGSKCG